MWRVGTSPWTFLVLVLALACWCLIGAIVPQASLTELGFRSGGESVQATRLFHAHALNESWVTWVVIGLLLCNAMGLLMARKGRVFQLNLLAILCGALALLGSVIGYESGTILVREHLPQAQERPTESQENVHQSTDFVAESRSSSGMKRVELPFRLRCEVIQKGSIPCTVEGTESGPKTINIPSAGEGSSTLMGYELALIGARPTAPNWRKDSTLPENTWLRLGQGSTGPILQPGEVLELSRGQAGGKVKLGSIQTTDGGTVLITRTDKILLGTDTRVGWELNTGTNAKAPLQITHVQSPRWLKLAYQRPSSHPMSAALFHFGPFLLLLSVLSAALGLTLRDPEENP